MHILLVEDNLVNQRLAIRLLEKNGHTVVTANHGREALTALARESFDLVLMDVQMPEMDGLEATHRIRERERSTHTHLPIIAMTAHAMKGDRERCLEAGMDGYVSKPIQTSELFKVMAELAPPPAKPSSHPPAHHHRAAFDPAVALEQVQGDQELLKELAELFMDDSARLLAEINQAIARQEPRQLERAAHTLKGAAGNFGAREVVAAAQRLEEIGRGGAIGEASAACLALEVETRRLNEALGAFSAQCLC